MDKGEAFELLYHFANAHTCLTVRTEIPRSAPRVPSVTPIIPGAVLYEREIQDMFGIVVEGLSDPRPLIVPDDWPPENYPLRKDWKFDAARREDPRRKVMKVQIPIGPQHPALKEPISLRMTVDGEVITDADLRLGYNHRGLEKLAEEKTYLQNIYLTERICGICSHSHATCFVQGVEKLLEVEPPRRGQYIRYLVSELERVHSHLLWLGVAGHEAGFDSFFMYTWRDREVVMDLLEMISGNRVHYAINTLGGVRRDVDDALKAKILDGLGLLRRADRVLPEDRGQRAELRRPAGQRRVSCPRRTPSPSAPSARRPGPRASPRTSARTTPTASTARSPSRSPRRIRATSSAGRSSGSRSSSSPTTSSSSC